MGHPPDTETADHHDELRGRALRFILVAEMMKHKQPVTVAELCAIVDCYGYQLPGRPSKVISDALRWERRRGRVVRVARGVYCYWRAPRTTARRIGLFAARCHQYATSLLTSTTTTATTTPRASTTTRDKPPWANLSWLWST